MKTSFQGIRSALTAALVATFALSCAQGFSQEKRTEETANKVFLLIGDGMGVGQRELAARYLAGKDGSKLAMDSLPASGLANTSSLSGVTDSAAAGTALSCGVKTTNKTLGLDKDGKRLETIAELAKRKIPGMKVGILTNTPVNHATPAAFFAHVSGRGEYSEISDFAVPSGFELFAGESFLLSKGKPKPDQAFIDAGYALFADFKPFATAKAGGKYVFVQERPLSIDARGSEPFSSAKLLEKAIELLDGPGGFFIMLEGGRIDWACHENDAASAVFETLDFDGAVKVAADYCKAHPGSLLVVTADHETGALSTVDPKADLARAIDGQLHSKAKLLASMEAFKKAKTPFQELRKAMIEEFGLNDLTPEEEKTLESAYAAYVEDKNSDARSEEIKKMYGGKNPVLLVCSRMIDARAGVKFGSFNHSGAKVRTTAAGAKAELFNGDYENTEIPAKIKKAMGLD